ncbi:MAG: EAL domain-containing protein [Lachnospiraceae bacterium]|nr:EAL domain-containing protein [Lachnospiraceae bacterium]
MGYVSREGFHATDENGNHCGYNVEYLNAIAEYTGWKYEFVEGSWSDCLKKLECGEIDLLGAMEKTDERTKTMRFASLPFVHAASCLFQLADNTTVAYEDYSAFDGMTIGIVRGASIASSLEDYARQHQFSYTLKSYETEDELHTALEQGEVDSICNTDNRDISDYSVLACFGYIQLYYVTSPEQPELGIQLDRAMEQIHAEDHYYHDALSRKYFNSTRNIAFTDKEMAYIKEHGSIPVQMYNGMGHLFCRYDKEQKQYVGIIVDVLELLSERTGLNFDLVPAEDQIPWEYLPQHPDTLAAPFFQNELIITNESLTTLNPIIEGNMVAFIPNNKAIDLNSEFTLALPMGNYHSEQVLHQYFPNAHVIPCICHRDGLEMLRSGRADMALVNEIVGAYQVQSPFFSDLQVSNIVNVAEDLTMGLSKNSSPELISILNKGISSLSVREIRQIVVNHAATPYKMNWNEWFYKYRLLLIVLSVSALASILFLTAIQKQKKQRDADREKLLLAEERNKLDLIYQEKLFRQANFDPLTGLYNEAYFSKKANRLMEESPEQIFTFLRLNLKHFKMVNELYGEDAGDFIIRRIADYMREHVGKRGVYGRLYADEFAICMAVDKESLEQHSDACIGYIDYHGQSIRVEVYIGVYVDTQQCRDAYQALDYTQIALRHRECADYDHYFYYKDVYMETMFRNQEITNLMEAALRGEQFQIYLQPQFDITTQTLVGAEALVRWIDPVRGIIAPNHFISVFESNGFIYQLDSYVCDKVCALLARWMEQDRLVPISINLSRVDLENPNLPSMLKQTLDKYSVPIQYLHLEITESAYVENYKDIYQMLQQLRDMGFCLEMDDFGSGYSCLNMLKDIPVDILKLDMKFFDGEQRMDCGGNIIESLVKLAHSLGIMVVAEGVETEREANFLRSIHCSIVQGFLYGRPEPTEDFEKRLVSGNIGEKWIDISDDDSTRNLYWKIEKYNLLLQNEDTTIFDYEPSRDYAIFSYQDEHGALRESGIANYTKTTLNSFHIHPDSRSAFRDCLKSGHKAPVELDFQGSNASHDSYEWLHAVFYYYESGDVPNRIIAIIKKRTS